MLFCLSFYWGGCKCPFSPDIKPYSPLTATSSVTIISCIRLYYIIRLYYLVLEDRHYSIGFVCSCAELNLAIITASIPALWPLARRWFPGAFASLGIDRPHLYPDIEVAYATNPSGSSRTSKTYRSKIVWKEQRNSPSESHSDFGEEGGRRWGKLPDLPDHHLYVQHPKDADTFGVAYHDFVRQTGSSNSREGVSGFAG